jgi:hypothetical protein
MKTGRTLQELAIELARQAKLKRDFVMPAKLILTGNMPDWIDLHKDDRNGTYAPEAFVPMDLFHRQIAEALNIPARYYDLMRKERPWLVAENLGGWLCESEKRYMIRTMDGKARAFLSDRYRRLDNYEIAEAVLPVIRQLPDARVESCEITDHRMYIKVVNPRLEAEVKKGDIVQAGIVISNSEVGLGSVSVMPLVYRLVCANGMVINGLGKRKYHIGRELEESWELFSDETMRADDEAFMLKLADIVRAAVDEARFAQVVYRLRETVGVKITGDVPGVVELTAKEYGFNQNEQSGVLRHLIEGGDLSLYGLSNAVTRVSQDVESYDRATALEAAGWQIVTMAPQLWRVLNGVNA